MSPATEADWGLLQPRTNARGARLVQIRSEHCAIGDYFTVHPMRAPLVSYTTLDPGLQPTEFDGGGALYAVDEVPELPDARVVPPELLELVPVPAGARYGMVFCRSGTA